jgi:tetratricopeptide (TPR) repeat protein
MRRNYGTLSGSNREENISADSNTLPEHICMKLLTSLAITIALAAPLLAQTPAPVLTAAEAQARQELNEAAAAYRAGNFAAAQAHSERALLLDPQNKTAPYFVARAIHSQYKPGDFTPENVAKAREAIIAYQRILERSHGDDEAYKAVAYLYSALKEGQMMREWILQRARDVSMSNDKRAEAFVALASKDWDCSFKITELPSHKLTTVVRNEAHVTYKMPKERADFERAQECANRGLEMVNIAITLTPENESAWAYKANLLLELSKLAEMLGEVQSKRELRQQYDEALKQTTKLSNRTSPTTDPPQLDQISPVACSRAPRSSDLSRRSDRMT